MPLALSGTTALRVVILGTVLCGIGSVWCGRFLAYRQEGVPRIMWLIGFIADGAPGHGPVHLLYRVLLGGCLLGGE